MNPAWVSLALLVMASPAAAQILTSPSIDYGSDDLGRAMRICATKEIPSNRQYAIGCLSGPCNTTVPGSYPEAWKACYSVRERWNLSEMGHQEQERLEAIERDRRFVDDVAGRQN